MSVQANFANIYGECVTELCEAEQDWRRKSSSLIGQQQTNLSNQSSGVEIPRDTCTRFGHYLYSTKCSWIMNTNIRRITFSVAKPNTDFIQTSIEEASGKRGQVTILFFFAPN